MSFLHMNGFVLLVSLGLGLLLPGVAAQLGEESTIVGVSFTDTNPDPWVLDGVVRWTPPANTDNIKSYKVYIAFDDQGSYGAQLWDVSDAEADDKGCKACDPCRCEDQVPVGKNALELYPRTRRQTMAEGFPANWLIVRAVDLDGQEQDINYAGKLELFDLANSRPPAVNLLSMTFQRNEDPDHSVAGVVKWSLAEQEDLAFSTSYSVWITNADGLEAIPIGVAPRGINELEFSADLTSDAQTYVAVFASNPSGNSEVGVAGNCLVEAAPVDPDADPELSTTTTLTTVTTVPARVGAVATTASTTTTTADLSRFRVNNVMFTDTNTDDFMLSGVVTWSPPVDVSNVIRYEVYIAHDNANTAGAGLWDSELDESGETNPFIPVGRNQLTIWPTKGVRRQTMNASLPANWLLVFARRKAASGYLNPLNAPGAIRLYDRTLGVPPSSAAITDLYFKNEDSTGVLLIGTVTWVLDGSDDLGFMSRQDVFFANDAVGTSKRSVGSVNLGLTSLQVPYGIFRGSRRCVLVYAANAVGRAATAASYCFEAASAMVGSDGRQAVTTTKRTTSATASNLVTVTSTSRSLRGVSTSSALPDPAAGNAATTSTSLLASSTEALSTTTTGHFSMTTTIATIEQGVGTFTPPVGPPRESSPVSATLQTTVSTSTTGPATPTTVLETMTSAPATESQTTTVFLGAAASTPTMPLTQEAMLTDTTTPIVLAGSTTFHAPTLSSSGATTAGSEHLLSPTSAAPTWLASNQRDSTSVERVTASVAACHPVGMPCQEFLADGQQCRMICGYEQFATSFGTCIYDTLGIGHLVGAPGCRNASADKAPRILAELVYTSFRVWVTVAPDVDVTPSVMTGALAAALGVQSKSLSEVSATESTPARRLDSGQGAEALPVPRRYDVAFVVAPDAQATPASTSVVLAACRRFLQDGGVEWQRFQSSLATHRLTEASLAETLVAPRVFYAEVPVAPLPVAEVGGAATQATALAAALTGAACGFLALAVCLVACLRRHWASIERRLFELLFGEAVASPQTKKTEEAAPQNAGAGLGPWGLPAVLPAGWAFPGAGVSPHVQGAGLVDMDTQSPVSLVFAEKAKVDESRHIKTTEKNQGKHKEAKVTTERMDAHKTEWSAPMGAEPCPASDMWALQVPESLLSPKQSDAVQERPQAGRASAPALGGPAVQDGTASRTEVTAVAANPFMAATPQESSCAAPASHGPANGRRAGPIIAAIPRRTCPTAASTGQHAMGATQPAGPVPFARQSEATGSGTATVLVGTTTSSVSVVEQPASAPQLGESRLSFGGFNVRDALVSLLSPKNTATGAKECSPSGGVGQPFASQVAPTTAGTMAQPVQAAAAARLQQASAWDDSVYFDVPASLMTPSHGPPSTVAQGAAAPGTTRTRHAAAGPVLATKKHAVSLRPTHGGHPPHAARMLPGPVSGRNKVSLSASRHGTCWLLPDWVCPPPRRRIKRVAASTHARTNTMLVSCLS